jgi:multidrug efflux system outer membrane protein
MARAARRPLAASLALLSLVLAGCAVGPNYKRPLVPVPERFYGEGAPANVADARSLADAPWWEVFDDPVLKSLVDEALRNGFDARLAAARVQEARAQYGIARSEYFPSVDYQGSWNRQRADRILNPAGKAQTRWTVEAGLSWELDLWGRIRRLNEAALAQYLATEEARRGVMLSLVSDVAVAYLELRELDEDLAIAKSTTAAFQDTYDLFRRRLEGGAASALETERAAASLAHVAAQIPEIERAIVARENQINFLLGRNPQPIPREGPPFAVPPDVPPGLPSTLLTRRPDIRRAEQLLVAANAGVGVAKADFFPRLSLTGFFGQVSPELGSLFEGQSRTWGIGPSLVGPLFQGGRVKRGYEAARARRDQAVVSYEATVSNAFGEVSRALVDRAKLVETERQRAREVAAYQEAVRLANVRYGSGLSAYFEVLEAQQQLFPAEIALAQTRRDQLVAVVDLYRALGGGWEAEERARGGAPRVDAEPPGPARP